MADGTPSIPMPHNLAAEAAVLGAILFDNAVADAVWEVCHPADFYAPVHQWLAAKAKAMIDAGQTADGVTLREAAESDEFLKELGGGRYLIDLLDAAAFGPEIRDYARIIRDLAVRRRLLRMADGFSGMLANPPEGMTATALLAEGRAMLDEAESQASEASASLVDTETAVGRWLDMIEAHADAGTTPPAGLSTGLRNIDRRTGRWQAGELVILAGRPSMGKTAIAANIAQGATVRDEEGREHPARVGFISMEMDEEPLAMRWAASSARKRGLGRVNYSLAREGKLGRNEIAILREGWRRMPRTTLWDTRGKLSVDEVRLAAKAMRRRLGGLDLLVIDYLQIMKIRESRNGNRASDIGEVTSDLKALAKQLKCPILCLSQLSRECEKRENKRPMLSDLRESGSIEQDADIVIFAYRDEYYLERNEPQNASKEKWAEWRAEVEQVKGVVEAIVAKARMSAVGTVHLHFEPETDAVVDDKRELKEETLV